MFLSGIRNCLFSPVYAAELGKWFNLALPSCVPWQILSLQPLKVINENFALLYSLWASFSQHPLISMSVLGHASTLSQAIQ